MLNGMDVENMFNIIYIEGTWHEKIVNAEA